MRQGTSKTNRSAFTLLELMLAIAIMLVLATMLLVAINKVFSTARQTMAMNDVQQLSVAMENFKTQYGFYPPSQIKLCEKYSDYPTGSSATQLDTDSIALLTRMFPKITDPTNGPWMGNGIGYIDWDGNGRYTGPCVLEGDQCLAFFLGGIPAPLNPPTIYPISPAPTAQQIFTQTFTATGFSQNPYNPSLPRAQGEVRISFFDFNSYAGQGRLVVMSPTQYSVGGTSNPVSTTPAYARSLTQPSLLDVYSYKNPLYQTWRPYLYFSSYKTADGYNRYYTNGSLGTNSLSGSGTWSNALTDCPTFTDQQTRANGTFGVWPYALSYNPTTQYITFQNSNTFQILCAGKDGFFGSGSDEITGNTPHLWPPPASAYSAGDPSVNCWKDDQSNFCPTVMGISR